MCDDTRPDTAGSTTSPGPAPGRPSPGGRRAGLRFSAAGVTDRGPRLRNEDAWLVRDAMLVVADGVGGRPAGRHAADLAARTLEDRVGDGAGAAELVGAVLLAHRLVRDESRHDSAKHEMACTIDAVVVGADGLVVGVHVGDSRAYFCPFDTAVEQVTQDEAIDGALVQCLGGPTVDVRPRTWRRQARPGDRVVLASDGLWSGGMGDRVVSALLRSTARLDPRTTARLLVDTALDVGATDNVTVIVADVQFPDPSRRAGPIGP